jgi:signal peptidase I
MNKRTRRFLFPSLTPKTFLRIAAVALAAYLIFGHLLIPLRIKGSSMEPTYHNGGINFCWALGYLFSRPARHDVVLVRLAGKRVVLMKRVVAFEGESVAFRDGKLFVNGCMVVEAYVRYPCKWNLTPRQVKKGYIYVVGDNRSMTMEHHSFGQTPIERIVGVPLW